MARKRKVKYNNPYKIRNELANEIRALPNAELADRASLEYVNWMASEKLKKEDPAISAVRGSLKDISESIKDSDEYKAAKEAFDKVVDSLMDASEVTYKEELRNLLQPYVEDIKLFKGCCKIALDEINRRRLET
jgi:hypothetical protein